MRILGLSALIVALVMLTGCSSVVGDADQAAQLRPPETTGTIAAAVAPPIRQKRIVRPAIEVSQPDTVAFIPVVPVEPKLTPAPAPSRRVVKPLIRDRIVSHRFRDAKPINFGRASPRVFAVHGVDVSRWQGQIDWETLRGQGANFAFIKATDGGDHLDPMFRRNWRAAADAGLKRGAYHFFYWCRSAAEQARWFIRNVPREKNALPPVVDVEWNSDSACKVIPSPAQVQEKMRVFITMVERHYGQRPIIYTAPGFYHDNLEGAFLDYPFWLRSVAAHPAKVFDDRKWVFWQYSGSGLSHGVDGRIDLNVFNGSAEAWYRWIGSNTGGEVMASAE